MKTNLIVISLLSCLPAISWASTAPVLVKSQGSGYTPIEWMQTSTCEIYLDRVEIKSTYSDLVVNVSRSFPISISSSVQNLVARAAAESFNTTGGLCDAASTKIYANAVDASGKGQEVVLFAYSSCNQDGEREGPASAQLLHIVKSFCD